MKVNKSLFLLLPAIIALAGCSKANTKEEILDEYDFVRDYADKQGYRGWYYLYGEATDGFKEMTFHEDLGTFKGPDYWMQICPQEAIPGLNNECALGFKVPKDCTINLTFTIVRNPPDGFKANQNGLWVYSYINTPSTYLFSEEVKDKSRVLHTLTFEASVKKDDMVYVVLNNNGDNNNDNSIITENIKLK